MRLFLRIVLSIVVLSAIAVGFVYWYDQTGQRPDPNFDASVASPTYTTADAPQITFDIAHRNFHTPTNRYRPLADLLKRDGYVIAEQTLPFAAQSLEHVKILVIANALGPDGHEGRPAFEPSEELALADWVRGGGALLLVADHVPFGDAAKRLAGQFGVTMHLAYARDDANHAGWDNEVLLFSRANGLLMPGPIVEGRSPAERIKEVVTFTGQSLSVPPGAAVILRMGDNAYDWESNTVRHPARGHAQGIAFTFGKGRVVMLGEAGLLSAQVDPLGFRMGMSYPEADDKQFALNIFHWLSGALN